MRNSAQIGAFALAASLAAILAGSGSAGSSKTTALASAKLYVSGASQAVGGAGGVSVKYQQLQSDDPVARVTFYVPTGYRLTTGQAPGTKLGTAAATIFAADLNAVVPVTGTVEVGPAAEFAAAATACTGTATHSDIWALRLSAAGTPLVVPVFVDAITAGPLAAFAAAQLVVCLPPGDIPTGTPGRATLGAKVLVAQFTSSAVANPAAAGEYRWRATVTPYAPNTGKVNPVGTVEVQSLVNLPSGVTARAKVRKAPKAGFQTVSYGGTLLSNLKGVAEATVDVFRGSTVRGLKKFKSQTTSSAGAYTGSFTVKQVTKASALFLLARATVAEQDLGPTGCQATPTLLIPCQDATAGAYTVTSSAVKVTIPAAPKKKKK